MNYFPATSSILSAKALNDFLKDAYRLSADTNCQLIRAGINHTYAVTGSTGKYVFRIYSLGWRTEQDIREEIRLLDYLRANNISVSYAIADMKGNYIQQFVAIEGSRPGVLFSYAEGEKIIYLSPETHSGMGGIMANIHKKTEGFSLNRVTYTPEVMLDDLFEKLKQYVSADTDEMKFMETTRQYLSGELKKADTAKIRQGAVHLDMWFDNLNINKQNEITIFDFDFCGNGWLSYDVAYYILQLYFTETDLKEYETKRASFLAGYEQVVPLSDEERRLLPILGTVLYFFYLGVQCERYENWSNVFVSETYLKRFIVARVKRYFDGSGHSGY